RSVGDAQVDSVFFGYTGRLFDSETDLQNNLNRWYDADTGRWISQDPIGFAAGDANLYRYVGNGPTNATDPSGLEEFQPINLIPQASGLGVAITLLRGDYARSAQVADTGARVFHGDFSGATTSTTAYGLVTFDRLALPPVAQIGKSFLGPSCFEVAAERLDPNAARRGGFYGDGILAAEEIVGTGVNPTRFATSMDDALRRLRRIRAPKRLARTSDWTTSRGVIRISDLHSGPSWRPYVHNHESVHRFFTPGAGVPSTRLSKMSRARQILRLQGYQHSSILRYSEEAIAESYALLCRTGNLSKAIGIGRRFPISRGYVTVPGLLLEGGIGGTIYIGLLYGAYELGEHLFDE
ncbi:MAG: RHS repeat-associated core domain-containing protein, partial [Planctomycetota bacterium]